MTRKLKLNSLGEMISDEIIPPDVLILCPEEIYNTLSRLFFKKKYEKLEEYLDKNKSNIQIIRGIGTIPESEIPLGDTNES